jgi:hypothetical protein
MLLLQVGTALQFNVLVKIITMFLKKQTLQSVLACCRFDDLELEIIVLIMMTL